MSYLEGRLEAIEPITENESSLAWAVVPDHAIVGDFVCSWGRMEQALADKRDMLRRGCGDNRILDHRARASIPMILAELRALLTLRDRHDRTALAQVAELECTLQRLARFRQLLVDGFRAFEGGDVLCRDAKNELHVVKLVDVSRELRNVIAIARTVRAL